MSKCHRWIVVVEFGRTLHVHQRSPSLCLAQKYHLYMLLVLVNLRSAKRHQVVNCLKNKPMIDKFKNSDLM